MTPIENLAFILAVLVVIKLLFLFVKPSAWLKFVKTIYSRPLILGLVELVLSAVVLYFLLQDLTIVQILAAVLFGALLTGITWVAYSKELLGLAEKVIKKGVLKRAWLPILLWVALIIWGVFELFK